MKLLASIVVERGLCVTMHRVRVSSVTDKPEQHGIILCKCETTEPFYLDP